LMAFSGSRLEPITNIPQSSATKACYDASEMSRDVFEISGTFWDLHAYARFLVSMYNFGDFPLSLYVSESDCTASFRGRCPRYI